MHQWELITDPREFAERAAPLLRAQPVVSTILATTVARKIRAVERGEELDPRDWWLLVNDGSEVVGAGMAQPPDETRRLFLLDLPSDIITGLAEHLARRGDRIDWVNGARPTVDGFARAWQQCTPTRATLGVHTRLFELDTLVPPPVAPGKLREPTPSEHALLADWLADFRAEAELQAGRVPRPDPLQQSEEAAVADVAERVADHRLWVWDDGGQPVHLTGFQPASFGVARIGPVYTPPQYRGHGYAGSAVAEVSRRLQTGARVCLFTDQANPVSNALYERLGYRPVVDMANFTVAPL